MIQRRQQLGPPFKPGQPFWIAAEYVWQHFDGHLAVETGVFGPLDLSHATYTELLDDPVVRERGADHRKFSTSIRSWP